MKDCFSVKDGGEEWFLVEKIAWSWGWAALLFCLTILTPIAFALQYLGFDYRVESLGTFALFSISCSIIIAPVFALGVLTWADMRSGNKDDLQRFAASGRRMMLCSNPVGLTYAVGRWLYRKLPEWIDDLSFFDSKLCPGDERVPEDV